MSLLQEFKEFAMRGNVVDLAVAVVIGVAFGALVTALVEDLVTPLIAAIFGRMGDLIINVFRRDLGVKNTGIFIIGRDGILTRVEKLIFVGPMFYYIYIYLQRAG